MRSLGCPRCCDAARRIWKRSDPSRSESATVCRLPAERQLLLVGVSDIPIGSPPVPPGRHAAPQGWYPDPLDASRDRYWDGWSWTRNLRASETPRATGPAQPGALPPGDQYGQYHQPGDQPYGQGQHPQQSQQPPYGQAGYGPPGAQPQPGYVAPPVGPTTADGVPLAPWGWRFLAAIVDLIIVSLVAMVCSIPVLARIMPKMIQLAEEAMAAAEAGRMMPIDTTQILSLGDTIALNSISMAVAVLYFGLFWRFRSATPGQLLSSLRVVPVDQGQHTEPLPWTSVVLRALVFAVPLMVGSVAILFAVLNCLFPLWNEKKQAIHDLVARTQIVKIK